MKEVIILSGISGSGKSTYADELCERKYTGKNICTVSADHYFMILDSYYFDPKKLGRAHAQCLRNYTEALLGGRADEADVIIVDNTNTTVVELAPYVALASAYEAKVTLVTVEVGPETAAMRNRHGVPLITIQAQADNLRKRNCPRFWDIEYINIWTGAC